MSRSPDAASGTRPPIAEQILAAAKAWVAGRPVSIDYDDPGIDEALASVSKKVAALVDDPSLRRFMAPLRTAASVLATAEHGSDGSVRHHLRRDLVLVPVVGTPLEVHGFAVDADRMRSLSEIVRRAPEPPFEDVVLLPVVLDADALAAPTVSGIRSSAVLMAASLEAEDAYDDAAMTEMASAVASHLKGVVADADRLPPPSPTALHAFVALTSSRTPLEEEMPDFLAPEKSDGPTKAALKDLGDVRVALGLPGPWPVAATRAASILVDASLRTLLLREGLPPSTRFSELRYAPGLKHRTMLCSGIVGDKVVGPVGVPVAVARQDVDLLLSDFRRIADVLTVCGGAEVMLPVAKREGPFVPFDPATFEARKHTGVLGPLRSMVARDRKTKP